MNEPDKPSEREETIKIAIENCKAEILDLKRTHSLLLRAKNAYIENLKKEILAEKAGLEI